MTYIPETLDGIEALPCDVLTCLQVSKVLGVGAANLHDQAVADPAALGFPVIRCGTRVKIPKGAFLRFMRGEMQNYPDS